MTIGAKFFSELLFTLGIVIFIIGLTLGISDLNSTPDPIFGSSIQTVQGIIILASGLVSGLILVSFSYIIGVLVQIKNNTLKSKSE